MIGRVTNIRNSGLVLVQSMQWGLHGVYSQEIPKIDGCGLELSVSLSSSQSSTTLPYSLRDLSDVNVIHKLFATQSCRRSSLWRYQDIVLQYNHTHSY